VHIYLSLKRSKPDECFTSRYCNSISCNLFCIIYKKNDYMRRDCLIAFGWIHIKALLTNKNFASISLLKNSTLANMRPFLPHNIYTWHSCIFYFVIVEFFFFNKIKTRFLRYCILSLLHCWHCAYAYLQCIILCLYVKFSRERISNYYPRKTSYKQNRFGKKKTVNSCCYMYWIIQRIGTYHIKINITYGYYIRTPHELKWS